MDSAQQKELERFIHEQLQKLPEREAPEELADNVMRRIAQRANLPWWKQSFLYWPKQNQIVLFAVLAMTLGGAAYAAWSPAEQLTASSLIEKARPFGWITGVVETVFSCFVVALRTLSWHWLAVIGGVFTIMYVACVGAGVALVRVASHRPLRIF